MDSKLIVAINQNNRNSVTQLVRIEKVDVNGGVITPLMHAILLNKPEMVSLLIELGADKEKIDDDGHTALRHAVLFNKPEIVSVLIKLGADMEKIDNRGNTALMNAVIYDKPEMVRLLIELGANTETIIDVSSRYNKGMKDTIVKALRTREIIENNEAFVLSILDTSPGVNKGIFSVINEPLYYLAKNIAEYAFGEQKEEGAEESKSNRDAGIKRRKLFRKKSVRKKSVRKKSKSKRKSVSRKYCLTTSPRKMGFSQKTSCKAQGLLKRTSKKNKGKYVVSPKYKKKRSRK